MKRISGLIFLLTLLITSNVYASLTNNYNGTITQVRDDGSSLMWMQNANFTNTQMNWQDALDWAEAIEYAGYDDWRLPTTLCPDGSCWISDQATGSNCSGSEMGSLFHSEGVTFDTPDFFINLQYYDYWSSTEWSDTHAFNMGFGTGYQDHDSKLDLKYVWAVRDINASPVPEPATFLLLLPGIVLISLKKIRLKI